MTDPSPPVTSATADWPARTGELVAPEPSAGDRPFGHVFWFGLLLSVALVLAGASFAVGAYQADALPETVVREYFAALQRGDAAAALGYGTVPDGSRDLLTDAVLAAQNATGPVEDFTVQRVRSSRDAAIVYVTYTIGLKSGPVAMADSVPVVRDGHGWRLAQSVVRESISSGSGSDLASLAGARVPDGDYLMFPGAFPVTYDTPALALAANSRVVDLTGSGLLEVDAVVTPAGRAALTPPFDAALRACLAGTSATQELCPLPDELAGVPGSLRGKATRPANLAFRVDTASGRVSITGTVPVTGATYELLDDNNIAASTAVHSVSLRAFGYPGVPATVWWDAS
jgi:hypothetical protein